jgi:hypothetical protein
VKHLLAGLPLLGYFLDALRKFFLPLLPGDLNLFLEFIFGCLKGLCGLYFLFHLSHLKIVFETFD